MSDETSEQRADLHCKLERELHAKLLRKAGLERRSITSIVTALIEEYVKDKPKEKKR